eukprot:GHVH01003837.1.p1 GENE.GHVH01003837.1~~GHVH01003837.1.p1  ORF type:complete len:142 (-),score=27.26 GHVH01003837.1:33-458(-)
MFNRSSGDRWCHEYPTSDDIDLQWLVILVQPLCPCALFIAITSIIALCCVVAVQIMTIYRTANVESLTDTAPHYQLGKIIGEFDNMSIRQIAVQQDDESSFSASFAESVETDGESSDEFEETISSESIRFDDEEYEYDEFD